MAFLIGAQDWSWTIYNNCLHREATFAAVIVYFIAFFFECYINVLIISALAELFTKLRVRTPFSEVMAADMDVALNGITE